MSVSYTHLPLRRGATAEDIRPRWRQESYARALAGPVAEPPGGSQGTRAPLPRTAVSYTHLDIYDKVIAGMGLEVLENSLLKDYWRIILSALLLFGGLILNATDTTFFKGEYVPVSYTHLDVYKRQMLPMAVMENCSPMGTPMYISVRAKAPSNFRSAGVVFRMSKRRII